MDTGTQKKVFYGLTIVLLVFIIGISVLVTQQGKTVGKRERVEIVN